MTREEIVKLMTAKLEETPYLMHKEDVRNVINCGGQITLPFEAGDAPITFPSRWALAQTIDELLSEVYWDNY